MARISESEKAYLADLNRQVGAIRISPSLPQTLRPGTLTVSGVVPPSGARITQVFWGDGGIVVQWIDVSGKAQRTTMLSPFTAPTLSGEGDTGSDSGAAGGNFGAPDQG